MLLSDFFLLIEAKREKQKDLQMVMRFQTALICESLVGGGKGSQYVMNSWNLGEAREQLTPEKVKELIKKKREKDALRKLNE